MAQQSIWVRWSGFAWLDAVKMVCDMTGHKVDVKLRPDMPTGPLNRVAGQRTGEEASGREPKVLFKNGLKRTIDWYFATKNKEGS